MGVVIKSRDIVIFFFPGGVATSAVATVANAWSGGMSHVDVYLFPCYSCGDPEGQVKETGQNLIN